MRIALITPEHPGCGPSYGVGSYVAALAALLRESGHAVLVLVTGESGCFRGDSAAIPQACGHVRWPAALRPWRAGPWLTAELERWRPDLIEIPNWGGLGACIGPAWPLVVRLSTPVATIPPRTVLARLTLSVHRHWESRTVQRAQVVIANSLAMAGVARRCYGSDPDVVIPHAWTGAVAATSSTGADVLAVGRIEWRKGTDVLLAAWPLVRARCPQASLHLVGADRLGLDRMALAGMGVIVHGVLEASALDTVRRRCAIQAIPSRTESFGLVALEAWAAGLAVVASDCAGLAETVGAAAALAPVGDAPALAAILSALLADPGRRSTLAALGRELLRSRFAPDTWLTSTMRAYALASHRHAEQSGHRVAPP